MALLQRGPHWRRCLQGAAAQQRQFSASSLSARAAGPGDPFKDSQDPSKTWQAYGSDPQGRGVPGPEDEGVEREVKWGKNIPASADQAKEELKYAGKGLAESVEQAAGVLLSKGKDAMAKAQRAMGLESDRPEMSQGTMGAAGKMEHAPPGAKSGGVGGTPENVRAKYDEISQTEKPNFPQGERSVNELFPEMATAAGEQSNTPDRQHEENERIRRELRSSSSGQPGEALGGLGGTPQDTLSENLHNRGP